MLENDETAVEDYKQSGLLTVSNVDEDDDEDFCEQQQELIEAASEPVHIKQPHIQGMFLCLTLYLIFNNFIILILILFFQRQTEPGRV